MPNCKDHPSCDLTCSECGDYYCRSDSHDSFSWVHHKRPAHSDLQTIDLEHDLGLRDLTDPFTKEPF